MQQRGEQLSIEVPVAPKAVGRWSIEHELKAYGERMGAEALTRQRKLAEEAKECTCGEQEKADQAIIAAGGKPRKLLGWQHKSSCNSYQRSQPKLAPRISAAEQTSRYRAEQLRAALDRSRAAEESDERSTTCSSETAGDTPS